MNAKLSHMSYSCPCFTDKKNVQYWHIERRLFSEVFGEGNYMIEIPFFQRRYCWGLDIVKKWWKDVSGKFDRRRDGTYTEHGGHSVGKCIFKFSDGGKTLICIDGQQRCTTMSLLLSSIRDALLNVDIKSVRKSQLLSRVNAVLFRDVSSMEDWVHSWATELENSPPELIREKWQQTFSAGKEIEHVKTILVPSFHDRVPFFQMLLKGVMLDALKEVFPAMSTEELDEVLPVDDSLQAGAKGYFDETISNYITGLSVPDQFLELKGFFHNALKRTSIMYCEVLAEINLSQLFLWLQEKTLFGMGALLFNPTPGKDFSSTDLARNLLFAPLIQVPNREELYTKHWAIPLEAKLDDKFLYRFLQSRKDFGSHVGKFEKSMLDMAKSLPGSMRSAIKEDKGILLYAKFVSYLETLELRSSEFPSPAVLNEEIPIKFETCVQIMAEMESFE